MAKQDANYVRLEGFGPLPDNFRDCIYNEFNQETKVFCLPLRQWGIQFFMYVKRFKDGSSVFITNLAEWLEYFFSQHYYSSSDFDNPKIDYPSGQFLWVGLPAQHVYSALSEQFNIGHGITLIQRYADCHEFFYFGAEPNNHGVINFFANQQDKLKYFILFYKDRLASMLKRASLKRILLPERHNDSNTIFINLPMNRYNDFFEQTKRFYVNQEDSESYLTRKEMECLKYYIAGKMSSEIATLLNLSIRTVETHFENIKAKIGAANRQELIRKFSKFFEE